MTQTIRSRATAGAALLALSVAFAAPGFCEPSAGAFGPVPTTGKARKASVPAAQAAEPISSTTTSKPFFKSTKGIVSVILMAGVTGWVIQSRNHNKVVSPGRQ
jgi:hypothetical protein